MGAGKVLQEIAEEVSVCKKCDLHLSRKKGVPGEGPVDTKIMLIGEGPGFYENQQGRPFVGASGDFLTELLNGIGLNREEVFITNVVKCRPPGNRDPQPDELLACAEYLDRQIEVIDPQVIITLGRFSMARYMQNVKISQVHGQSMWSNGRMVIPMYHPAAALHQPSLRATVEEDFAKIPEYLQKAKESESRLQRDNSDEIPEQDDDMDDSGVDPVQLSLF